MRTIEIEFLETYKETDSLCNEAFHCERGISDYIGKMSDLYNEGNAHVEGWKEELSTLKRLRRLRNKIVHESGKSECQRKDLQDLKAFKRKLKNETDSLSKLDKYRGSRVAKRTWIVTFRYLILIIIILIILFICHQKGLF